MYRTLIHTALATLLTLTLAGCDDGNEGGDPAPQGDTTPGDTASDLTDDVEQDTAVVLVFDHERTTDSGVYTVRWSLSSGGDTMTANEPDSLVVEVEDVASGALQVQDLDVAVAFEHIETGATESFDGFAGGLDNFLLFEFRLPTAGTWRMTLEVTDANDVVHAAEFGLMVE